MDKDSHFPWALGEHLWNEDLMTYFGNRTEDSFVGGFGGDREPERPSCVYFSNAEVR